MTKKELTTIIKNYIKEHKELQGSKVLAVDYEKASKDLNIDYYYIMMVLRYGRII